MYWLKNMNRYKLIIMQKYKQILNKIYTLTLYDPGGGGATLLYFGDFFQKKIVLHHVAKKLLGGKI